MDSQSLRGRAKEKARRFLELDSEYRMGYLEAERPHPRTVRLSQTYESSVEDGVRMLLSVDAEMAERAAATLASEGYADFADRIRKTVLGGGRVIFSGCGSSGRLSMRLEQSFRHAIEALAEAYPDKRERLLSKKEAVGNIMTGGDYAVIRAVESFEDSAPLGREQVRELGLSRGDLLVGVTATGETTSILGTAVQALENGADVYMLICADHRPLVEKMARAREVYLHPNCRVLTLPCGSMALTGSSRMQSSTFEQLCGAVALEGALCDLLCECGVDVSYPDYATFGTAFLEMTHQLMGEKAVALLANATRDEQRVYEAGGLMTLFADEYMLDVLTDTTERAPTFMTPPFCSSDMVGKEPSWAFAKNPACDTKTAWTRCFLRRPNCLEWDKATYARLNFTPEQIERIFDIGVEALERFMIGNEPMPERENVPCSHAMWVSADSAPEEFFASAARYASHSEFTLEMAGVTLVKTHMDIFEHLSMKLMLNTLSTGVMARMGRITGNWMTCLAMSNKKLIDRSARIVTDVCGVSYEQALEENYYSQLCLEAEGRSASPAETTILRLGLKNEED